jgi:glucose-6-phosphate isomerase
MDVPTERLTDCSQWRALATHARQFDDSHLRDIVAADAGRGDRLSIEAAGLTLDLSRNWITDQTLALLVRLAEARGLGWWRDQLFAGEPINHTEQRAAGHPALRVPEGGSFRIGGEDVAPEVRKTLERMRAFAERLHSGDWTGAPGEAITDIVHVGIGGSHLGPQLCCEALSRAGSIRVHFLSSVDPVQFDDLTAELEPAHTLFIIASKSFRTEETMVNARLARDWIDAELGVGHRTPHFVAVSAAVEAAEDFGIPSDQVFAMREWVGGRYSLWGAVGLPVLIHAGTDAFEDLLAGAHAMDAHFVDTPLDANMPVILGLLGIWYRNFHGCQSHAVLPYLHRLRHLPDHLQQLEMESLGKSIDRDGQRVDYDTAGILWGSMGNEAQHAFFQMLHQGTTMVPMDLIVSADSGSGHDESERCLVTGAMAQGQALLRGRTDDEVMAEFAEQGLPREEMARLLSYKLFEGGRPSNTITMDRLSPHSLGALIALYEHKVFVQSVIWNLNPFDQWGVELGKRIAADMNAVDA